MFSRNRERKKVMDSPVSIEFSLCGAWMCMCRGTDPKLWIDLQCDVKIRKWRKDRMSDVFFAAFQKLLFCYLTLNPSLFCLSFFLTCSIMLKPPTSDLCRDAHQFRPVPVPLPHAQPPLAIQLWTSERNTCPVLSVPPWARGLEEAQPGCPSWPRSRSPLLLPAGPTCRPGVPGPPASSSQLWRALRPGGGLVRSGFGVSKPPLHAATARGTCGAEGYHHGSPGA